MSCSPFPFIKNASTVLCCTFCPLFWNQETIFLCFHKKTDFICLQGLVCVVRILSSPPFLENWSLHCQQTWRTRRLIWPESFEIVQNKKGKTSTWEHFGFIKENNGSVDKTRVACTCNLCPSRIVLKYVEIQQIWPTMMWQTCW